MAKQLYKLSYSVKDTDRLSSTYGYLLPKQEKFSSFNTAVDASRRVSNNANTVGKPVIERIA